MSVITQEYDIDFKATGEYPVVKMSQFDTGSRTIVFTVYDGHELAHIDGMVARVDGTRSDGVEFSSTCTVSTGSKVSFTISQEMTKSAGKHAAELVLFDASGNPIGTQNFVIEVEPATMVRDSAASADDRTLYDQYTQSLEEKFDAFKAGINDTIYHINELIGASSKSVEVLNATLDTSTVSSTLSGKICCRVTYDPLTALVTCRVSSKDLIVQKAGNSSYYVELGVLPESYLPEARLFDYVIADGHAEYRFFSDSLGYAEASAAINRETDGKHHANAIGYAMSYSTTLEQDDGYQPDFTVSWYARGGKYMGVTPVPGKRYSFGNGLKVNADGVVSVKAGRNLGFSSDGTLNAAGGSGGDTSLVYAGSPTASGTVEYYSVEETE